MRFMPQLRTLAVGALLAPACAVIDSVPDTPHVAPLPEAVLIGEPFDAPHVRMVCSGESDDHLRRDCSTASINGDAAGFYLSWIEVGPDSTVASAHLFTSGSLYRPDHPAALFLAWVRDHCELASDDVEATTGTCGPFRFEISRGSEKARAQFVRVWRTTDSVHEESVAIPPPWSNRAHLIPMR